MNYIFELKFLILKIPISASWFAFVDVDEDQLIDRDELQQFFMTQLELNGNFRCMKNFVEFISRSIIEKGVHAVEKTHKRYHPAGDQKGRRG